MTQSPRRTARVHTGIFGLCALVVAASFPLAGCAPIVFEDGNALVIAGDPPPPPPKPEPPPKPKPTRVEVTDNAIVIKDKIHFDVDKSTIREESHSLLDEIVQTIKDNPHIKKLSIEGHTSTEGSDRHNQKLTDGRAKAVMKYIVDHGIAQEMLTAKGFGESRPIVANDESEEDRETNRRVEFLITEQDVTKKKVKVQIDPETGKETVLEETTVE